MLHLGYSKPLVLNDIPALLPEDEALLAYKTFTSTWNHIAEEIRPIKGTEILVIKVLAKIHKKEMLFVLSLGQLL